MEHGQNSKKGLVLALLLVVFSPGWSLADIQFNELDKVFDKVSLGMEAHFFYMANKNTYFGSDAMGEKDYNWAEQATKLRLTVGKNLGWTDLEAQVGSIFSVTAGEDHYAAHKDETDVSLNQAWLKFKDLGKSPFDLTIGQQDIKLEKNFLIGAGNWGPGAATWISTDNSFPFAVRLDGDFGNFNSTAFWARSKNYIDVYSPGQYSKQGVEIAGFNLHYNFSETAYLYGGYYYKSDTEGNEDNDAQSYINNLDIGIDVSLGGFQFESELVYQIGDIELADGSELDQEALGGFAALTYRFPVAYKPFVRMSTMYFSGDKDPDDDKIELFDPVFSGFVGWNRWITGEIVGDHHLSPNGNKTSYIGEIGFNPTENITMTFAYLKHYLSEKNYFGSAVTSAHYADEFFLNNDFAISDNLYLQVSLGLATPGEAAKQIWQEDETSYQGWTYLIFYF